MKNNKGITLITLTVTIVVLLILASVGTYTGIQTLRDTRENTQLAEVGVIQQAIIENYIKYKNTGNNQYLRGTAMDFDDVNDIVEEINKKSSEEKIELKIPEETYEIIKNSSLDEFLYYEIKGSTLKELGFEQENDEFIVNYSSGEVINKTLKNTISGKPLYVYGTKPENLPQP